MEHLQIFWIHGGLALVAGIIILFFPKVFFFLIGGFLVVNGIVAFSQGGDLLFAIALVLAGVLIFLSPQMVAWFVAFYLLVFAGVLFFTGAWFLAIPILIFALFVALIPKIAPFLIGFFLIVVGGLSLMANFMG